MTLLEQALDGLSIDERFEQIRFVDKLVETLRPSILRYRGSEFLRQFDALKPDSRREWVLQALKKWEETDEH
jgi:hypothetical protein